MLRRRSSYNVSTFSKKEEAKTLTSVLSTPVEVDIDGNGIVESQENLAPDQNKAPTKARSKVTKFLGKRRDICTDKEIPRYFHKQRGTDI